MKQLQAALVLSSLLICFLTCSSLYAADEPQAMHWSANKSHLNRKTNIVNLRGDAYMSRDFEELRADEIDIYLDTNIVHARGKIYYNYGDYLIRADAMELDLKNKTGVVHNGNLTNGRLALRGTQMELMGKDHIQVKDYEYTTCVDCPNAWSMTGKNADLTFEGYAYIKDFIFRVKDASLVWFPYMILPLKTKRQSGLLFPRFGLNEAHGSFYVQPYFWAINDWSDMTFGVGDYSKRGGRLEWEGRYALTQRSQGTFNLYWTKDDELRPTLKARAAGKALVTQALPWGIEAKLRFFDVTDAGYPIDFVEDIPGRYEPVLTSDLFFSRNDPNLSTTLSFKRIKNLLYYNDDNTKPKVGFDPATVQEVPKLIVNTNNQYLFGSKFAAGVEARFNRFIRSAGPIDNIPNPNVPNTTDETIRQANRLTVIPNVHTTLNPWPWLSVVPTVQYRSFFYNFNATKDYPNLARGYLLTQAESSFQIEKVYPPSSQDPEASTFKHTIRPQITYSVIPLVNQSADHKFVKLIQSRAGTGKYFDNSDIVPLGASQNLESYFTPLGHSLTYGFISQLYRKTPIPVEPEPTPAQDGTTPVKKIDPDDPPPTDTVSRLVEFSATQTWDVREAQKNGIELSPVFTHLLVSDGPFAWNTEYTYYFYLHRYTNAQLVDRPSPHRVNTGISWIFNALAKNDALTFERSVGVNYTFSRLSSRVSSLSLNTKFSINDYLMPSASLSYDLLSPDHKLLESKYGLLYQSPSECWRIEGFFTQSLDRGTGVNLAFSLNLMGRGFTSLED